MKIAITLPRLPLSGVGTSVGIIEKGLTEAGYEVDIVITGHDPGNDLGYAEKSGWNLVIPGQGIRFLPHRLQRVEALLNSGKYSIVINNTSPETQLILPCLRTDIIRVSVMRVLNSNALRYLSINSEYLHAAVGISKEMVRAIEADDRIKAPVRLIPNCTRVKGGKFPVLRDHLKLCYVGRLSVPDKNVTILPHIAKSLIDLGVKFSIEIAGDGPAKKQLIKAFNSIAPGCAIFKGMISREQVQQIMGTSNFVLLPSVSEGLSNVMLEGMALGCVPICSDIENFKWVLEETSDRLQCRLNDHREYAHRIETMIKDPGIYKATQIYLQGRQQKFFTPENTIKGYKSLIEELSNGDPYEIPPHIDFRDLQMPKEYRQYCSPGWHLLQKIKNIFG
jgi:glycosyltransferase involved in cell wall biosynthesis